MTPEQLKAAITEGFETALATKDGLKAMTPDGKPSTSLKEYTEVLKAASEWYKVVGEIPEGQKWGAALTGNGGARV